MKIVMTHNKGRGLYGKLLSRLAEVDRTTKGIPKGKFLPYAYIRAKLGRNFSMTKSEVMEVIFFLRDTGLIEISQVGIKLNYSIKND